METLKFYTKPDCPLCDEVREILEQTDVDWQEINILADPMLRQRFQHEIPVLESGQAVWLYRDRERVPLVRWVRGIVRG